MVNLLSRVAAIFCTAVLLFTQPFAQAAEVVNFDTDVRFNKAAAREGMYHPDTFQYTGVYLAEPVSSTKEVVVFVHGALGHPGDFRDIVRNLDSTRYQAWVVYYPSGMKVLEAGAMLADQVNKLAHANGISHVQVFAHSMGGLVAWQMTQKLLTKLEISELITVSTPWNGHWASRLGVWFSPNPVASWSDLVPDNAQLKQIWSDTQRPQHKLVFTLTRDDSNAAGDGTISKSSQLAPEMVGHADEVHKLIGTHTSVLHDEDSVKALLALLS